MYVCDRVAPAQFTELMDGANELAVVLGFDVVAAGVEEEGAV